MAKQDFTLIGAGIMSATLGVLLKQLLPDAKIAIYERLDKVGAESSDAWNNAGTGHSAFCELNYTPENEQGGIDISKALKISESFEVSKQLWAYLVKNNLLPTEDPFINDIDHMSFVWGDENLNFLRKRHKALTAYPIFKDMLHSENYDEIKEWVPLMMTGRNKNQTIGATRMSIGTDVNFGAITRGMIAYLQSCDGVEVFLGHQVEDIDDKKDGTWKIEVKDLHTDKEKTIESNFVFIGAGGGALKLLEKSDIPEADGYGGFPVSGQFLKCNNQDVILQHEAKVYGMAEVGAPPMSVPHLDTRMLNGVRSLLFGPYAGFSTKFLKNGSYFDLPLSIDAHNIFPMLRAGLHNISLTKYLIEQVVQSPEERFKALEKYYPNAKIEDWELITAGQRVQIIKKDAKEGGVLKFGTEIVTNKNKTLAALLGASPGASTSVSIMLSVLNQCFPMQVKSRAWQKKLTEMIPSLGHSLITDEKLCKSTRNYTTSILKLEDQ
ncbi:malate dehydrogenase (quinone) [Cellulophaga omnivescoria]|uniref:malate dehydrogenase (quinone) n=1 Tax=Cellulophaga omnivescoria TaxID=1888890 RepID=UPI00098738BE|nr:malate dehydrogenase (quinone) [Cellulophaga omnivescoria]WBU90455.1 malate dehydrogenase (quinone) [Cellulophaga omnivescoria]